MDHFREPVKKDCEELLSRFQTSESVRYEKFLEIWKDLKFNSIFHGKPELTERRNFARLILSIASTFFFPPYTFQVRVGALYLLYGLFNTQLATPKEKIRIALKDWEDVLQLQKDAVSAQHYDVVFIFRKLVSDKAFYFTAMPTPLFFREKRKHEKGNKICEEFVDPPSRPQQLVTTDMLEEIANIHEHYEALKKSVLAEPDPNLDLVQQNLVPKLNSAILTYSTWQRNCQELDKEDAGEGPSNQESSCRARLLASIKSKSYGQVMEASKSRRHRQTQLIPADTDLSQKVLPNKKQKLSLRKRTLLRFKGIESEGLTQLWSLSSVKETAPEKRRTKFNWKPDRSSDSTSTSMKHHHLSGL